MEYTRNQYAHEIVNRLGSGYALGITSGAILYFIRGMILSPRNQRIFGGIAHVRDRAPVLGGSFALWCGSFALVSGYMKYKR